MELNQIQRNHHYEIKLQIQRVHTMWCSGFMSHIIDLLIILRIYI
jgi:hypothetical protein